MIPERGDILHLQFDPASRKEMKGHYFCLVVSPRTFNQRFHLARHWFSLIILQLIDLLIKY